MNTQWFRRLPVSMTLAAILALGALTAWAVAWFWAAVLVDWVTPRYSTSEYIVVSPEAQVFVRRVKWRGGADAVTTYRTLEGQPVAESDIIAMDSAYLPKRFPRRLVASRPWADRVSLLSTTYPAVTRWYLVHDGRPDGFGYFVGFDAATRQPTGYLGLGGYSAVVPPKDEQLQIVVPTFIAGRSVALPAARSRSNNFSYDSAPWYFVSGDRLYYVNFASRTVQKVDLPAPVVSVSTADVWIDSPVAEVTGEPYLTEQRTMIRLSDSIVVEDARRSRIDSVALPETLRESNLSFYDCQGSTKVVVVHAEDRRPETQLYWIKGGQVVEHRQIQLGEPRAERINQVAWITPGLLPSPVALALFNGILAPRLVLEDGADTLQQAYAEVIAATWLPSALMLLISAAAAAFCYRWHRRYNERGAAAWAVFVFLAGPAGLLAYWLHRRWPHREACGECGTVVPRDRLDCLRCRAEFAPPAPQGIEIFA